MRAFYQISVLLIVLVLIIRNNSFAQDEAHHKTEKHEYGFHRLTGIMAYAFLDNSFSDQSKDILIAPALGLNYDYIFNRGLGLGLHSEIFLQKFKIEDEGSHEEVVRESPVAICGMLLYKPHHRWTIMAGYGIEFEKHENFQFIRAGAEYGIELPKNWEVGFSLEFDFKLNAYNSLLFGIGFTKLLSKKNNNVH